MVRKTGSGFAVFSHKTGKKLSRIYKTKEGALQRLREIQYFKHKGK